MSISKGKTILIVTYNDYPVFEGLGVRIKNVSRCLRDAGYRVVIYAPNIDYRRARSEYMDNIQIIRINVFVPAFLKKNRIVARALSMVIQSVITPFIYFRYIRQLKASYIMAEHFYSVPVALIIKLFSRKKLIVDDIINVSEILRESGHKRISGIFSGFEKWLFGYCDHFIYTSDVSKKYYEQRGACPDIFVPNGVNCEEFTPAVSGNDRPVIFFNGSTFSSQNLDAIDNYLQIAEKLSDQGSPNVRFRLCCWPAYNLSRNTLDKLVSQREWLTYYEGVERIEKEIQHADIMILPYSKKHLLNGGSRLKALEYMSCGKLVISTREGVQGIPGIVPGEHYVLAEDIMDFPGLILRYSNDPGESKRIGDKAREFILHHHDWRATTKGLVTALEEKDFQELD